MQSAKTNYAMYYSGYLGSHSSVLISKLSNDNTEDEAQQPNTTSIQTEYYLNISISFSLQDCGSQCIFFPLRFFVQFMTFEDLTIGLEINKELKSQYALLVNGSSPCPIVITVFFIFPSSIQDTLWKTIIRE